MAMPDLGLKGLTRGNQFGRGQQRKQGGEQSGSRWNLVDCHLEVTHPRLRLRRAGRIMSILPQDLGHVNRDGRLCSSVSGHITSALSRLAGFRKEYRTASETQMSGGNKWLARVCP